MSGCCASQCRFSCYLCYLILTQENVGVYLSGMHGAGLTHAVFLRSTSALIELFPSYVSAGEHFAAIAAWRQLVYLHWINNDLTAERADGRSTVVPPSVVAALVHNAVRRLCPLSTSHRDDDAAVDVPPTGALPHRPTSLPSANTVTSSKVSV